MSYSFAVRGKTKAELLAAAAVEFNTDSYKIVGVSVNAHVSLVVE